MSIDPLEFRRVMGHWATGVAVIATRTSDGTPRGLTASAVCSLSLHPPLLLVCIDRSAETHDCIRDAGIFAVNMLAVDQEPVARRFAGKHEREERFDGLRLGTGVTGAPILDGVVAWADCAVDAEHEGGDHTIFVGRVLDAGNSDARPLVAFRGVLGGA
jgi:flavin reductase (DIM6/NTAB) family NADH-FMN oxidoreductase RutF